MVMFASLWEGAVFAIGLTVAMIILAIFGGGFIDDLYDKSADFPGHDSEYVTASQGLVNWYINLWHAVCALITIFGWGVFLQAIFKKDSSSMYTDRSMGRY
jgi:ABC-type amino acid transport system permease subunit